MARELRPWLVAPLFACAVIAFSYLPPRGVLLERAPRGTAGPPLVTAARLRAQELAAKWRSAETAVRLGESRRRLEVTLASGSVDTTGPTLFLQGPDSIVAAIGPVFEAEFDTVWLRLGLVATKIAVAVVVDLSRGEQGSTDTTPAFRNPPAFLLPDSTDRATCVALFPGEFWTRGFQRLDSPEKQNRFRDWLKSGLGPCAFYAAYGAPGKPVRRWLAQRDFDVALYPDWDRTGGGRFSSASYLGDPRSRWFWEQVYHFPAVTVACLAGRAAGCRAAVLQGSDGGFEDSVPRVLAIERPWWREQRLVAGERYLADLASDVGRERFLGFWNSSLPVDTALAAALKEPIGEWTERWEQRFVPRIRLGGAAPLSAALLGLLLAGAAVTGVVLAAGRRQVL